LARSITEGKPTREGAGDLPFALIDEWLDLPQGLTASIGLEPGVQMFCSIEA
jgi:hypothetical protein